MSIGMQLMSGIYIGLIIYIFSNIGLAIYRLYYPYKIRKSGVYYQILMLRYKSNMQDYNTYWKVIATLNTHHEAKRQLRILRGKK